MPTVAGLPRKTHSCFEHRLFWIILSRLQFTVFLPFVIHATVNSFGCLGQRFIQFVPSARIKSISSAMPHSTPMQTMELRRSSWASVPNGGGNCRSGLIEMKHHCRVFPRSAPRVISEQNLILTHIHPDLRSFRRTRGA